MRRLAIVLGVLGCAVGAFAGYENARDVWNARAANNKFKSLVASAVFQKELRELMDAIQKDWFAQNAPPDERKKTVSLEEKGRNGVERWTVDPSMGDITSIELSTGEKLERTEPPPLRAYLLPLMYPISGFLIPWGAVRVLTWVGTGFFQSARQ
jgi:hypothetical protein